jgi:hypothetical protein
MNIVQTAGCGSTHSKQKRLLHHTPHHMPHCALHAARHDRACMALPF